MFYVLSDAEKKETVTKHNLKVLAAVLDSHHTEIGIILKNGSKGQWAAERE